MDKQDQKDELPSNLFDLPPEIVSKIFGCLSYSELSRSRMVCNAFDRQCKFLLNDGFFKAEQQLQATFKDVKSRLPRRESERRKHSLARHCDILNAMETRMSLLSMTYMKYIDSERCCFIPGAVLDEFFRLLHIVKTVKEPPRTYELTSELRDISCMAMEHFDEKIAPNLTKVMNDSLVHYSRSFSSRQSFSPLVYPLGSACAARLKSLPEQVIPSFSASSSNGGVSIVTDYCNGRLSLIPSQSTQTDDKLHDKGIQVPMSNIVSVMAQRKLHAMQQKMQDMEKKISEQSTVLEKQAKLIQQNQSMLTALLTGDPSGEMKTKMVHSLTHCHSSTQTSVDDSSTALEDFNFKGSKIGQAKKRRANGESSTKDCKRTKTLFPPI